ncbi:MAG TPA: hypothetical protein PKE21_05860 [Flavobacteriales bacterium]|nr:hypothetical protein [Flavobacteriales bacterium]HMR26983.1 hypothetical protein [Flavobacteriales bacterium]
MAKDHGALLIRPKNAEEADLLQRLVLRMGVKSHRLSEDDLLDMGLAILMRKADRTKKVPEEAVMKLLRR